MTELRPPSITALAWRQTLRDFRAGELRLLAVAVLLAVAALTAVGFFADRLSGGLQRDARQLLGGDAVVGSDRATPPELIAKAQAMGLRVATTVQFPSMARAPEAQGGASRLVAVKSVSSSYPLRGVLQLKERADGPPINIASAPEPGTVWVDAALLDALQLAPGATLLLGDAALRVARLIVIEPDRGAGFSSFSPRVMLNEADLPATGLVQPASRLNYRLVVAAPDGLTEGLAAKRGDALVREFTDAARAQIKAVPLRGVRVESLESGRPEMKQTLDRAEKFLNLVALLSALLAAVAVGIAARDFASRHLDDCAMLRVLGLSQRRIAGAYTLEFALVGLLASLGGVFIGWAIHHVFVLLLAGLVQGSLPAPGPWPAAFGLGVGMTLLVYGVVALIVKADDFGAYLAQTANGAARAFGRGIVTGMPILLSLLGTVGMLAMLWVGGGIVTHGLHELGVHAPEEFVQHIGALAAGALAVAPGAVAWIVTAAIYAVIGLVLGALVAPVGHKVLPAH